MDDDEFINDFVLVKLDGQSTKPVVQLNRNHSLPRDDDVIAMGVGNTDPDPEIQNRSDILKQVTLTCITNDVCAEAIDPKRNLTYEGHILPSMLCTTGGPHNERDAW